MWSILLLYQRTRQWRHIVLCRCVLPPLSWHGVLPPTLPLTRCQTTITLTSRPPQIFTIALIRCQAIYRLGCMPDKMAHPLKIRWHMLNNWCILAIRITEACKQFLLIKQQSIKVKVWTKLLPSTLTTLVKQDQKSSNYNSTALIFWDSTDFKYFRS